MPDNNEINIKINLNTTESGTSLQRLHQQLNAIIADTERAQRQQGWAGIKGIENDTANIRAQIAALQEAKTETQRTRNTNLEYALGPEPTREIITTRRLPAVASSLSMAAAGDEEERERRRQALVRETTTIVQAEGAKQARAAEQEQQRQTTAAQREAARRIAIAEREAQAQQQAAMRGYSAADREAQSAKVARERQGDAVIANAVKADEEARRSAERQRQTIERQVQIQEQLAGKGYEAASRDIDREKQARERAGDAIIANAVKADEEVQKSATRQQQIVERQANVQERDAARGYEAASRDIAREQQMRERAGDAIIAAATRTDQKAQQDSERQKVIISRQLDAQEVAAQKGYEAADREIKRETAARQKQAEVEGSAAVRAAAARDEAVRKSIKFDEEISHRGISSAMGEPRVLAYSELESAHYRLQRFRAEQQAESSGIFGRINRIGSLEGQAAVINSIQALASGMSPTHVAMMEIPQVAGAAIQGGLLSFKQILTFIGSSAGIAATTLGTVAAALGQVIYTGTQARTAILSTQGSLTAQGFGGEGVISQKSLIEERNQLKNQFRNVVGSSDINTIFGQFNTAAPEAQQYRSRLASASVALAGTQNIEIEEAAKVLGKAAEGGAQGLIDFTKKLNIGDDLSRQRLSTTAISDPSKAFNQALTLIEQRTEAGRAATATEGNFLIPALPKIIASVKTDIDQGTIYNSLRYLFTGFAPIDQTKSTPREPQAMQVGLNLAAAGTPEMKERVDLQEKYTKLLQTQHELLQSIENLPQGGPEIDTQMERLSRVNESIRNIERVDRPKGVAETKQDAADIARFQHSLELAQNAANNDISQASRVVSARAALNAEITRQHASAVELQKGKARELSAAEIQAAQETEQARRGLAQRSIDIMLQLSNLERARIGPANISAQREIVQRDVATVTANKDVDESLKISQRTEEVNILRNERLEVENVNIAQIRQGELILQAKEDLAGIVTLRRQEAAIIEGSKDRTPADVIQARSNVIQSQIQASTQARRLELESVNSIGQAEERRFQTVSSLLNLQVARGTANTWQTLPLEQQITSQGTDTQAARLQALLNTGNLERSERIRVNEQLAALYEADAQKQIELQTRVTESIKAENARRVENFKNFFSSVETASSDLLIAGLLKSQTKEQAVKSFATSVVTSFVRETENMASKFAGKGLAKLLDVKLGEGEDSSISNVLAKKAGSVLGITLDEPKLNQAAIADRMKQAGDAQKQAGDLMLQAAREMSAKAQEAPYKGGKGSELSTDVVRETEKRASTTVDTNYKTGSTTASDPRGMEPVIRAAAAKYGHDPDIAVKVAKSEGLGTFSGDSGKSGGAFQLYTGGGLGNEFQKETGLDPLDPKNEVATIDYAMRNLNRTGWSPYHGAKGAGISDRQGISVNAPQPQATTPLDQPTTPIALTNSTSRSDYFLNNVSKVEQVKPQAYKDIEYKVTPDGQIISSKEVSASVRNGTPDVNTLGTTGGPNAGVAPTKADTRETSYSVPSTQKTIPLDEPMASAPLQLSQPIAKSNYFLPNAVPVVAPDQSAEQMKRWNAANNQPPGTPINSKGEPYSTSLLNMPAEQSARAKESEAALKAGTFWRRPENTDQSINTPSPLKVDQAVHTQSVVERNGLVQNPTISADSIIQNPTVTPESLDNNRRDQVVIKVDPASVAQGVQKGQQNVVSTFRSSIQEGTIQGQAATVSATNRDVQQTETNARDVESNSSKTEINTQSIDKLTNQLQTQTTQTSQQTTKSEENTATTTSSDTAKANSTSDVSTTEAAKAAPDSNAPSISTEKTTKSVGGLGTAASTAQNGLSLLSSAAGIASSAALLFGKNLSPTAKAIVGGIGLLSNVLSFGTKAASLLSAPATGGASLLAGLFEGGGVISAERGIIIPSITSAAGGDIISSITSAADGTVIRPVISAEVGTILQPIPSAAGGMFVKENSLSSSIRSGIQSMARGGLTAPFASGRMVSGPRVNDGKGGQLIIAHDGEMIVPRAETTMILNAINNPVVHSAEAGMILDNRGSAAISMSPPHMATSRSNIDNTIREAITNIASTSNTSSTNNNTTLNYTAHTTGYHPYKTRSDMEGMLRQHGSTLMRWAESNFKNGSWPQRSF